MATSGGTHGRPTPKRVEARHLLQASSHDGANGLLTHTQLACTPFDAFCPWGYLSQRYMSGEGK